MSLYLPLPHLALLCLRYVLTPGWWSERISVHEGAPPKFLDQSVTTEQLEPRPVTRDRNACRVPQCALSPSETVFNAFNAHFILQSNRLSINRQSTRGSVSAFLHPSRRTQARLPPSQVPGCTHKPCRLESDRRCLPLKSKVPTSARKGRRLGCRWERRCR